MPRFFMHVLNGGDIPDVEGEEQPDLAAARDQAVAALRSLAQDSVRQGHLNLSERIDIEDEDGIVLATVTLREALVVRE